MPEMSRKIIKIIAKILAIFVVAFFATIITEHYIFPRISTTKIFLKFKFLQKAAENVTIINKTEQITVKEDDSVSTVASKALPAIVNIISIAENSPISGPLLANFKNGTGVLATSDGFIITYRSSIFEKDAKYKAIIHDKSIKDAELVGVDEFSNLAYLKIDGSNLPSISFADSTDFKAGKKLIAIGSSRGDYQNRFSAGLLSNINQTFNIAGKTISSSEKLEGVFETDLDSQKEYLGGPVIDYNGEFGGIIGEATIDNQEKFFEIPANLVKKSLELAIKKELGTRPVFGAYYIPITKERSIVYNLERDRGALVFSPSGKQGLAIISGTPAEKSGLQINDIIIAIGGQEVNLDNPFSNLLSQYKKGEKIELLVVRDGKEIKIEVNL